MAREKLAPFIPSPLSVVYEALSLARLSPCDVLYDLGAGDGRVVVIAARDFRVKKAVGVEIDDGLVTIARIRAAEEGVADRVEIIEGDIFEVDVSDATVVYIYMYASINERLADKLERELKPGARVVTLDFPVPQWVPVRIRRVEDEAGRLRSIYLYVRGVSDAKIVTKAPVSRLYEFYSRLDPCNASTRNNEHSG
ncbi:Methyltransferase type 11 [Pyrolobus fumarii 1A]|uniref:Methyltransferase type 11 n=1 Tax=Pyrolobus fumarii (strain DSM 11204 / 1A) TaxID=694429 RepID=G0EDK1_PYRF1|nr:class I SAM-dependent methyltransferase [Pyrolobus fumarii]AEM39805.1 Methyltransferase type 11 [Pyrolobus fumarii 1A]